MPNNSDNKNDSAGMPENSGNRKLPDNPQQTEDAVSTVGDSANGKDSRTGKRDDEINKAVQRGGS